MTFLMTVEIEGAAIKAALLEDSISGKEVIVVGDIPADEALCLNLERSGPSVITFDRSNWLRIASLTMANQSIKIKNLTFLGAINLGDSKVCFQGCKFFREKVLETPFLRMRGCEVQMLDCEFEHIKGGKEFAILAEESVVSLESVIMNDTGQIAVVGSSAVVHMHGCKMDNAPRGWITIVHGAKIIIENCVFDHAESNGIWARNTDGILITDCQFGNVSGACLGFDSCLSVVVKNSSFSNINTIGIHFEKSSAEIDGCRIEKCTGNGIKCQSRSQLRVMRTVCVDNGYPDMMIASHSSLDVSDCEIIRSPSYGISITRTAKATVSRCSFINPGEFGAAVKFGSELTMDDCHIIGAGNGGVICTDSGVLTMSRCYIVGPSRFGLYSVAGGRIFSDDVVVIGVQEASVFVKYAGSVDVALSVTDDVAEVNGLEFGSRCEYFERALKELTWKTQIDEKVLSNSSARPVKVRLGTELVEVNMDKPFAYCDEYVPPKCMVCGCDTTSCMYTSCFHSVLCMTCWKERKVSEDVCEVCLMTGVRVSEVHNLVDRGSCSVCLERRASVFVHPCLDGLCHECATEWFVNHSKETCPVCRRKGWTASRSLCE